MATSSSSIDSNIHPSCSSFSSSSSSASPRLNHTDIQLQDSSTRDLSTDLRLGLSISPCHTTTALRKKCLDWPPVKYLLRNSLGAAGKGSHRLYVKVYMEGIPIGRKLDLYALDGYNALITTLSLMFTTTILCPDTDRAHSDKFHIVTYEDQEGDWMMVGDVPWEMFVASVKRLKITRADRC